MSGYKEEINTVVKFLGDRIPSNIEEMFIRLSGISKKDFFIVEAHETGTVAGVDGSNANILDAGFLALSAFRAVVSLFNENQRIKRGMTPIKFNFIGSGEYNDDFPKLFNECFGKDPGTRLSNADPYKVNSVVRDTLEYFVSLETLKTLEKEALLLIDGAFHVEHKSLDPIIEELFFRAEEKEINICAVTKRCEVTWGDGYPLIPAVMRAAEKFNMKAPWWIKIDDDWISGRRTPEWKKGSIFITLLHSCAKSALKVELPRYYGNERICKVMQKLAAVSCDGRIPGYPFPLFDAHRACAIKREVASDIRNRIIEGMTKRGIQHRDFKAVWEDIHDEFNHY